jgi:hypothetical protein
MSTWLGKTPVLNQIIAFAKHILRKSNSYFADGATHILHTNKAKRTRMISEIVRGSFLIFKLENRVRFSSFQKPVLKLFYRLLNNNFNAFFYYLKQSFKIVLQNYFKTDFIALFSFIESNNFKP